MKKNDFVDNKIWVENRIEELKEEVKGLIDQRIEDLNYTEVTKKFDKRNKRIK